MTSMEAKDLLLIVVSDGTQAGLKNSDDLVAAYYSDNSG